MMMVPKERGRCSRAGSRVNKLSWSDIAGNADDSDDDGDVDHDDGDYEDDDIDDDGAERKMQVFKSWFKS